MNSKSRCRAVCAAVCLASISAAGAAAPATTPPVAAVRPVIDNYFGTEVVDNYRWMEDRHSTEFLDWAKAENDYARATLAAIPGRDALLRRVEELDSGGTLVSGVQTAAGVLIYLKRSPGDEVFKLYARNRLDGAERLLLDPGSGGPGKHSSIDYAQLAPDGKHVAVGVSAGGSEASMMRIVDTVDGKALPERIDRVDYGSPAWRGDGKAFFYNRFAKTPPHAPETAKYLNSRAYEHRLGEPVRRDRLLLGAGQTPAVKITPVDFPLLATAIGSAQALAVISHAPSRELTLYVAPQGEVAGTRTPWRRIADVEDQVSAVALHGDDIYLLSHQNASRSKILRLRAGGGDLAHAETVVPESKVVIERMGVARDALYFRVLDAGVQKIRRLDFGSGAVLDLENAPSGGIGELGVSPDADGVIYAAQTWIEPQRWYRFDPKRNAAVDAALVPPWTVDTSRYEASEAMAQAADGTAIPLSLIYPRGLARDGKHPTWLAGYGAYGLSLTPHFVPGWLPLLERGGVVAVAHVRGGGEFGEDWHNAGKLANKPNTYRDLIACAEYLVHEGYTSPAKLAIEGGSAGGITVGMAMTERPDLFRVVFSEVSDSNALRAEQETAGDANAQEYGSTRTEAGFRALLAVDAVQHVKDGIAYPATLLTTGINDPRVAPWQPGKMAARLQAANPHGRPVLLRVDYDAGHGFGSTRTQLDELFADLLAFMFWQTGDPEFQPAAR